MESDELGDPPATYPVAGENLVESAKLDEGRVWINDAQYFGEVTERSWSFFTGGYQPAQKWLKDRKRRRLSPDDVVHYARILRALDLTAELMAEIDAAPTTPPAR